MSSHRIPAGWYEDPDGNNCERYWDGQNWTLKTRPKFPKISELDGNSKSISAKWWTIILISSVLAIVLLIFIGQNPELYF